MAQFETVETLFIQTPDTTRYTDYIVEGTYYCVIDIPNANNHNVTSFVHHLKKAMRQQQRTSFEMFEETVTTTYQAHNLPLSTAIACGLLHENIFYLKTIGDGMILVARERETTPIINDGKSASGYIQLDDIFIFTTASFIRLLTKSKDISEIFPLDDPIDLVKKLEKQFASHTHHQGIALFSKCIEQHGNTPKPEEGTIVPDAEYVEPDYMDDDVQEEPFSPRHRFSTPFRRMRFPSWYRTTLIVGIIVILGLLIWSVILGNQRRREAEIRQQAEHTTALVEQKLRQAEEVALIQPKQAQLHILDAQKEIENLGDNIGKERPQLIIELDQKVQEYEDRISQRHVREAEEFYDLAIENKDTQVHRADLFNDLIAILDKANGVVYVLSIENKSLDTYTNNGIKQAEDIAMYQDEIVLLVPNKGVFQLTANGLNEIIVADEEKWKKPIDIETFYGNLYILDTEQDQIYKYLVIESGYAPISNYLSSGESVDFKDAHSIAIDASIYVGFSETVAKYTRGVQGDFDFTLPIDTYELTSIYTSEETDQLFAWDKKNSSIYIFDKSGIYKGQIHADTLKDARDFFVYDDHIYILSNSKIHQISFTGDDSQLLTE